MPPVGRLPPMPHTLISKDTASKLTGDNMADALNILTICGSLRKNSFNAALARALPALAPAGLSIKPAPAWADIPIYNHDIRMRAGRLRSPPGPTRSALPTA